MGDFERTFGAGADVEAIIEAFSKQSNPSSGCFTPTPQPPKPKLTPTPDSEQELIQTTCFRCGGKGKIRQYKHIENGKCFCCNGAGVVWSPRATEPPQDQAAIRAIPWQDPSDVSRLVVAYQHVKRDKPVHDSFGILRPEFEKSCKIIEEALGRYDDMSVVSLGDIASAFGPGTALNFAIALPGITYPTLLAMMLPSAERAADASKEPGLLSVVRHARSLLNTQHGIPFNESALAQTTLGRSSTESSKACARALTVCARTGEVNNHAFARPQVRSYGVINEACDVLRLIAYEKGGDSRVTDAALAAAEERRRQVEDIISVSPLLALKEPPPAREMR